MVGFTPGYNSLSIKTEDTSQVQLSPQGETFLEVTMPQVYEYKFVTVEEGKKDKGYHEVIRENSREGWRLVQVLAPGAGGLWARASFCEVIFERQLES